MLGYGINNMYSKEILYMLNLKACFSRLNILMNFKETQKTDSMGKLQRIHFESPVGSAE
jgi:hypothetical protein